MPFKILTHDFCPPVQGGKPVWDGVKLPHRLRKVRLDVSDVECGAGWNYTDDLSTALLIAGLWSNGRPACCLVVEPSEDAVERGNKRRCSKLTIVRRCTHEEILAGIRGLPIDFAGHKERMVASQAAWYEALGRPERDELQVEQNLQLALEARGLPWQLQRYDSARGAWGAWGAWGARGGWGAWGGRDAWGALTMEYVALQGWCDVDPLKLTTGLRDAYQHGLAIAVPTAKDTLGWAMDDA